MARALKQNQEDAAYSEFLRRETASALADSRPCISSEEAEAHMDAIKASHLAQLERMMRQKHPSK